MIYFFIKKASIFLTSFVLIITLTFFLMHLLPGDPFANEHSLSSEISQSLLIHYGLDQSLIVQYGNYLRSAFVFDFGYSIKYQARPVIQIIGEAFPVSFTLGIQALIIAIGGGLFLGCFAVLYHTKWQEQLILGLSALFLSVPAFLLATLLQYFLAIKLNLFPIARWGSFEQTILPSIALALFPLAYIMRLTRANMLEVLAQDYILTARIKGLSTKEIIFKHVLPNALIPVVAYIGPLIATIFTGSFVIEKIFGIPGLGQWLILSINNRDYPLIMGITLFYSFILMFSNFVIECLYAYLDPRIKLVEVMDE